MNNYQTIIDLIKNGNRFLITSHAHPDGDGIGSSIALAKFVESLGKKAVVFNKDRVPHNLEFLPCSDKIIQTVGDSERFDATFLVDCSGIERSGLEKVKRENLGKIALIDHHRVNNPKFDVVCIDEDAAATGEVICRLFEAGKVKMSPEVATLLFCTFVVDTGWFKYSNTSSALFRDAAMLVEAGASPWAVAKALDESNPESMIKLLRLVLQTYEKKDQVAWIVLTQQMLSESGASVDVAEEFINYPRSILGVEVAILFREMSSGKWKVSFRSKDTVDVYKIASVFNGGGHSHAAGCTLEGNLASVKMQIFEKVLKTVNS
jgi:phosphoesterase RecJ-like protein